jgi:hypothetical protein
MKKARENKDSLYSYLDSLKLLDSGSAEAITLARKLYWRTYKAQWRKENRRVNKEITTSWTAEELKVLSEEAKKHKLSKTKFIKTATLAYIDKRYIVPNQPEVRKIAQLLALNYNQIQEMVEEKELHLQTGKIILEKILELERSILVSLHSPYTIEQLVMEAVHKNPEMKIKLHHLLEMII